MAASWAHLMLVLMPSVLTAYDYVFSENGLMAHQEGKLIAQQSIKKHLGEAKLQVRHHPG
jgi:phosphomannomutase